MKEIQSKTTSIHELLSNAKFGIDFYQREYRWEGSHVSKLVEDLRETFMKSYKPEDVRENVTEYEIYFIGTIILSDVHSNSSKMIVDGQQRITSLTLLLIALQHQQSITSTQKATIQNLIFSEKFGRKSYNLDVQDRTACMDSLFRGATFDDSEATGSVANILARYQDIQDELSTFELKPEILPFFIDWLLDRVFVVEITAYTDADAYTMFESMNDRGLSLTQWEMLRGYLLSKIGNIDARRKSNDIWKQRSDKLNALDRNALGNGIQAWLRSKYAPSTAAYDAIGNAYNRWVREQEEYLGLKLPSDYSRFIERDFSFYTKWYGVILQAASDPHFATENGLKSIRYNSLTYFTLQYPALLASLELNDSETDIYKKLRIVSAYIDCIVTRRMWSFFAINESYMRSRIFNGLVTKVRGKDVSELVAFLTSSLESYEAQFTRTDFGMHQRNAYHIRYILARITDHVELEAGQNSAFESYMARGGENPFEIEHIWADDFERDGNEFDHQHDFEQYRNRIGCLLLLPKSSNASFGAISYKEKREDYYAQNLLAQSLVEKTYNRNPRFISFIRNSGLPFRAHPEFKKSDLDARQELYRQLADQIWHPDTIYKAAES